MIHYLPVVPCNAEVPLYREMHYPGTSYENETTPQKPLTSRWTQLPIDSGVCRQMNHEIRTSLNAIMGFAQIIRSFDEVKHDYCLYSEIIVQEAQNLLDIYTRILNELNEVHELV